MSWLSEPDLERRRSAPAQPEKACDDHRVLTGPAESGTSRTRSALFGPRSVQFGPANGLLRLHPPPRRRPRHPVLPALRPRLPEASSLDSGGYPSGQISRHRCGPGDERPHAPPPSRAPLRIATHRTRILVARESWEFVRYLPKSVDAALGLFCPGRTRVSATIRCSWRPPTLTSSRSPCCSSRPTGTNRGQRGHAQAVLRRSRMALATRSQLLAQAQRPALPLGRRSCCPTIRLPRPPRT